jgi:uncharacterized membrane protein YcaP (DUF421 family)
MIEQLTSTWSDLLAVVIATVIIYVAFVALVRIMGQRSLASMAAFDLALVVAVGSLIARTSLLREPTLTQGLVALVTLFALQQIIARLRRFPRINHLVSRRPVLLVVDGAVLHGHLDEANLMEEELRQKLRLAGVGSSGRRIAGDAGTQRLHQRDPAGRRFGQRRHGRRRGSHHRVTCDPRSVG